MKPETEADPALVERSKAAFDASVQRLDARTLSRLRRARERAVDSTRPRHWTWLPAASVVAAGVIGAVILTARWSSPSRSEFVAANEMAEDIPLLLASEQIELLDEVEFYAWLDSESMSDDSPPAPNPI